jgi:twinfilin-like protein
VRAKTLFASTRAALVRELGGEKFTDTIFATDAEEVLDPKLWAERAAGASADAGVDVGLLSLEERELQGVKRAEDEERHGTKGRDLMGTSGSGTPVGSERGKSSSGLQMKITTEAKMGLRSLSRDDGENRSGPDRGKMVQLGIDLPTEMLTLISSAPCITPDSVSTSIPTEKPSYTFYHYPATDSVVFIYTCPPGSKVKERMLYASSRAGLLKLAESEGVDIAKRIEISEPSEIGSDRLKEELEVPRAEDGASGARQGFARPKRPGRK